MAAQKYRRNDFHIVIREDDRGRVHIEAAQGEISGFLSAAVVRKWLERPTSIPRTQLQKLSLMPRSFLPWLAQCYQVHPPLAAQELLVSRVTLEILGHRLAGLPWEQALLESF